VREEPKINCPIFQKQELLIKDITDKINKTKAIQEKAEFAEELQKKIDALSNCADFKKDNLNCTSCHFVANLRKRAANLIIKAKKLA
jgi:predicted metallo-beta-lactamase superfamily hydrolase